MDRMGQRRHVVAERVVGDAARADLALPQHGMPAAARGARMGERHEPGLEVEVAIDLVAQLEVAEPREQRMVARVEPHLDRAEGRVRGPAPSPRAAEDAAPSGPVVEADARGVQAEQRAAARQVPLDRRAPLGGEGEGPARAMRRVFLVLRHRPSQRVDRQQVELAARDAREARLDVLGALARDAARGEHRRELGAGRGEGMGDAADDDEVAHGCPGWFRRDARQPMRSAHGRRGSTPRAGALGSRPAQCDEGETGHGHRGRDGRA